MGRAPCCEKTGLKRGQWSYEEDQLLISYIQKYGHPNWRALPKHAGLLRCGKSCRLRWINYLRPDIKRGNFTKEEEDTIIQLHEMLGNRWSLIAAKLPGRTDNEIKNIWHTHLKKRLENQEKITYVSRKRQTKSKVASNAQGPEKTIDSQCLVQPTHDSQDEEPFVSHQPSSSESSSVTEATTESHGVTKHEENNHEMFLDDNFWSETLSGEGDYNMESNLTTSRRGDEFPISPPIMVENIDKRNPSIGYDMDGMELWYNIFMHTEELPELPEF